MPSTTAKSDIGSKTKRLSELEYEPSIKVTDMGVLVNDNIEISLPDSTQRTDGDLAATVANHIGLAWAGPAKEIEVTVRDGWITLEGEVELGYQKEAAANAVRYLSGVRGISNSITIKSKVTVAGVETAIQSVFERNALVDAKKIHVETSGNKVTLRGHVRSHAEWGEAERIAGAVPGVSSVDNELIVECASL